MLERPPPPGDARARFLNFATASWAETLCPGAVGAPSAAIQAQKRVLDGGTGPNASPGESHQSARGKRTCILQPSLRKYTGVSRTAAGKFQAQVSKDGRMQHVGTFDTEQEAACAVDECKLNGPPKSKSASRPLLNFAKAPWADTLPTAEVALVQAHLRRYLAAARTNTSASTSTPHPGGTTDTAYRACLKGPRWHRGRWAQRVLLACRHSGRRRGRRKRRHRHGHGHAGAATAAVCCGRRASSPNGWRRYRRASPLRRARAWRWRRA